MEYVYMRLGCNIPRLSRFIIKIGKTSDKDTSNVEHNHCSVRTIYYNITNEKLNPNDALNLFYNMVLICKRWGQPFSDFTFKDEPLRSYSKRDIRVKHHELTNNWYTFNDYKSYIRTINNLVNLMDKYNKDAKA